MVVTCLLLCRKETDSDESAVVLSKCTRDFLTALRYRIVLPPTFQADACCSSEYIIAPVQLIQEQRKNPSSNYRVSQALTRIRCLLKTVRQGDAAALNTLALVSVIVSPVLSHSRRHDFSLRFGRSYLNHGYMWLLFGENVYDIVTNAEVERLHTLLHETVLWFGVNVWSAAACQAAVERAMTLFIKPSLFDSQLQKWIECELVDPFSDRPLHQRCEDLVPTLNESILELRRNISSAIQMEFPCSQLNLYGSLHSGLAHEDTADVDLSLEIMPSNADTGTTREESQILSNRIVCLLQKYSPQIVQVHVAASARVPVIQGTFHGENARLVEFDITLNNQLGVANSELLRQYRLVDVRVKRLMREIKAWAKKEGVSSTKDQHLSSYGWMNMVIFYLQQVGLAPNLQCQRLRAQSGVARTSRQGLDVNFLTWKQASEFWEMPILGQNLSYDRLFAGFFQFYTELYPTAFYCVSIRRGRDLPLLKKRSDGLFLCIEDPFETFDSAVPHDLGRHVDSAGAVRIADKMHRTKAELQLTSKQHLSFDTKQTTLIQGISTVNYVTQES